MWRSINPSSQSQTFETTDTQRPASREDEEIETIKYTAMYKNTMRYIVKRRVEGKVGAVVLKDSAHHRGHRGSYCT